MGKCKYCGEKAGLFKRKHVECENNYFSGLEKAVATIEECISEDEPEYDLMDRLSEISKEHYLPAAEFTSLTTEAFDNKIDEFLEDGILSEEEETAVKSFQTRYKFKQDVLDQNGSLQKVGMAAVLREIEQGEMPQSRVKIDGHLPFNFQKSEVLLWVFPAVEFYEMRTRTEYRGGSSGASVRIAKGVYYRTSSFRGHPVKIDEMKFVADGIVALTTKHIYFGSDTKTFRTPYAKIISLDPYEDGIGIQKDGVRAKPQIFKGVDGWFVSNVISLLS